MNSTKIEISVVSHNERAKNNTTKIVYYVLLLVDGLPYELRAVGKENAMTLAVRTARSFGLDPKEIENVTC